MIKMKLKKYKKIKIKKQTVMGDVMERCVQLL